jgi:ribonucleotide reductase beta subunit family protein with ferritin-like domain
MPRQPSSNSDLKTTQPSAPAQPPGQDKAVATGQEKVVQEKAAATETKTVCEEEEPMLKHDASRLVLMPIKHRKLWLLYKKMEASIWHASEISKQIPGDLPDWEQLSKNVQHFLKHVLAFFSSSDTIVMENLALRFMREVKWPEAIFFYGLQIFVEQVHSETYGLLIDTYITDPAEKRHLFNAIETVPVIAKKAAWALRWIESSSASFAERLVAFACVEGIFFSGSFCAIFWIKKSGKMRAMTFSNELISRDEGLHCDFAIALHSMLNRKCSTETIQRIVREAVAIEHEFVTDALPVSLIGMNAETMQQYICYIADSILDAFGCPKIWNVQQPFDWMQLIDLRGKSNFFEITPSEYQDADVMAELRKSSASATSTTTNNNTSSTRAPPIPPPPSAFVVEPDF